MNNNVRALDRIQKAKYAWDTLMIALEVADFVTQGRVRRAINNAGRPKAFEAKRPADYTIKVKSERGTSRE